MREGMLILAPILLIKIAPISRHVTAEEWTWGLTCRKEGVQRTGCSNDLAELETGSHTAVRKPASFAVAR